MKSPWMIETAYRDGKRTHQAYRMLDAERTDTADNREYKGVPSPRRECVQDLVDMLNDGTIT